MLQYMLDAVLAALKFFVCWVVDILWQGFLGALGLTLDFMPEWLSEASAKGFFWVARSFAGFSAWIPVNEMFLFVNGVIVWKLAFLSVRVLRRILPF